MNSMERLNSVRNIALECTNCSLCETRKKVVFGEGNPDASIMFIGEAPGKDEDIEGVPFIGRSGKLLRTIIRAIDLDPEKDCYIANILKCRPPNNRDPKLEEIKECIKYLKKQIEIISPKMLVLLGKSAVRGIIPEYMATSVESLREMSKNYGILKYADIPVIVTYHPSALLRSPGRKLEAKKDFQYIRSLENELVETSMLE